MKRGILILLIIVVIIGAFFRFYHLDSLPPGLYPDEAINATDAIESPGLAFYTENNGREGLFHNLLAASFSVFGISNWALRFVPALLGTLTIITMYLFVREAFRGLEKRVYDSHPRVLALLASFFVAISFWHINFSRIGFRAILVPLLMTLAFYFLLKALRQKQWIYSALAGAVFGLGFYSYLSFRLAVLVLPAVALGYLIIYVKRGQLGQYFKLATVFVVALAVVLIPIVMYFAANSGDFISRASGISVFAQESPAFAFGESFVRHLIMFNIAGDYNFRHNLPGSPMLLWPVGLLFLIGIWLSVRETWTALRTKDWNLLLVHMMFLSWFVALLLPGALTYQGLPHALRVIGVIPVVYTVAAMGGIWLYEMIARRLGHRGLLVLISLFVAVGLTTAQFTKYFDDWANHEEALPAFTHHFVDIGELVTELQPRHDVFVVINEGDTPVPRPDGAPVAWKTPAFIEYATYGEYRASYIKPDELEAIANMPTTTSRAIFALRENDDLFNRIENLFPTADRQQDPRDITYFVIEN